MAEEEGLLGRGEEGGDEDEGGVRRGEAGGCRVTAGALASCLERLVEHHVLL